MALRADDVDLERDGALVRRFQAGDDHAFDELYRRYHDRLERFCRKRVGDRHTAEEVTQEAFTRALTALPDLGGEMRFYPWVSVIAARLCVDSHRRQSRSEPAADPDPGPVSGGQEEIIDAVDSSLVVTALHRLAPRHQDVLQLREVEGWSYQRIAEHYGVPLGTVETLLFRARRALRREFRIIDGAGLAALPVLGRLVAFAARARDRIPAWVPSVPSPVTMAAAATATAAAVAFAVAPAHLSAKPVAAAPSHAAPARSVGSGHPATGPAAMITQATATPSPQYAPDTFTTAAPAASPGSDSTPAAAAPTTSTAPISATAPDAPPGGTDGSTGNAVSQPGSPSSAPLAVPAVGAVVNAAAPLTSSLGADVAAVAGTLTTAAGPLVATVVKPLVTTVQGTVNQVAAATCPIAHLTAAVLPTCKPPPPPPPGLLPGP